MLINACIYELKVFFCDICSNGSHFEYNLKKNLLIKFAEIFDSQKMTKKTKSPLLGAFSLGFFELLEKFYNRKYLGL